MGKLVPVGGGRWGKVGGINGYWWEYGHMITVQ